MEKINLNTLYKDYIPNIVDPILTQKILKMETHIRVLKMEIDRLKRINRKNNFINRKHG